MAIPVPSLPTADRAQHGLPTGTKLLLLAGLSVEDGGRRASSPWGGCGRCQWGTHGGGQIGGVPASWLLPTTRHPRSCGRRFETAPGQCQVPTAGTRISWARRGCPGRLLERGRARAARQPGSFIGLQDQHKIDAPADRQWGRHCPGVPGLGSSYLQAGRAAATGSAPVPTSQARPPVLRKQAPRGSGGLHPQEASRIAIWGE